MRKYICLLLLLNCAAVFAQQDSVAPTKVTIPEIRGETDPPPRVFRQIFAPLIDTVKLNQRISEFTVEASRFSNNYSPNSFSNVDQSTLQNQHGQEASYVLRNLPSFTNTSDAGNALGYSYFRIRGIDQTRINVTLNGVPMNEPEDQGVYFSNYPDLLESVSQLQVQRGVGVSTNGTASYGGSIQMTGPMLTDSAAKTFGGGYGSFNSYRLFGEVNTGVKNRTGLYVRASSLHSDGYKDHSGNTSHSAYLSTGYFGKKNTFRFTAFTGDQRNGMAWLGTPKDSLKTNPTYNANSEQENDHFTQAHIQLHHNLRMKSVNSFTQALFYNYLQGNYDFDFNNFLGLPPTAELYNYAFQSHFAGYLNKLNLVKNNHHFQAGMHANMYQRKHTGAEKSLGQLYTNTGYKNEASAFAKYEYYRELKNGLLIPSADIQVRYTDFVYKGWTETPRKTWLLASPKAGISYSPSSSLFQTFYYSIGISQREPTRTDLFFGSDELLADSAGNPLMLENFTFEQVLDQELGWRVNRKAVQVKLNVFYMQFKNELVLNGQLGPNALPLTAAAAKSFRSGVETELNWILRDRLTLTHSGSYSFNRITQDNTTLQPVLTPDLLLNLGAMTSFKYPKGDVLSFAAQIRYQSEAFIDYANAYTLPAFFTADASITWQHRVLELSLRGMNLTNAKYYGSGALSPATGLPAYFIQAPLNFFLSAKIRL
jgi:iron complex outermembrane receptor protein